MVVFKYLSPDMGGGFPGNLDLSLAYKFTNDDEVILGYVTSIDKPTVIDLTNHGYFNLTGCKGSVLNHCYMIMGGSITPVDSTGVPTGGLMPIAGTGYDSSTLRTIKYHVGQLGKGYGTSYKPSGALGTLTLTAKVVDPVSGRVLKAYTTEPEMQLRTPAPDLSYLKAADSPCYGKCFGFCLEMQHFPDSPHHAQLPTIVLLPGETYR